ncbi:MAG: hypothetical protein JNL11_12965 [Bdellovibrionaceae bacterium]|nr:hypothetical protein [Pseudobdellovibrionaceae bacterium]
MLVVSSSAFAVVYVPYGQWRSLPYCGGQTRLICDDVPYARSTNSCNIEFRNSYGCSEIKLYVGHDFHPTYNTSVFPMQGSFYVDNSKVNWFSDSFRTYMSSGSGTYYDQVVYQFRY